MGWFSKLEHSASSAFSRVEHTVAHGITYVGKEIEDHPIESAVIGLTTAAAIAAAPFTGGASLAAEGEVVGGAGTLATALEGVDATLAASAEAAEAGEVAGEVAEAGEAGLEDMDAMEARFNAMEESGQVRTVEPEEEFFDAEEPPEFPTTETPAEPSSTEINPIAQRINELGDTYLRPALENPSQAALDAVRGTARLTAQGVTKIAPTIARVGAQVEQAATEGISEATGLSQNAVRAAGFLSTGTGRALVGSGLAAGAGAVGFGTKLAIDESNKKSTDANFREVQEELRKIEKGQKKKKKLNPTFASKL